MVVRLSGSVAFTNDVHERNASAPMVVRPAGSVMDTNEVHDWKAR